MLKEIESLIKMKKQINLVMTMKGKKIMVVAGAKSEKGKIDPPVSVTATADEIEEVLTAALIEKWEGENVTTEDTKGTKSEKEKKPEKKPEVGTTDSEVAPRSTVAEKKEEEPKKKEEADLFAGW